MATLASQLKTDYTALVVTPHYEDTDLTKACEYAAARAIRYGASDSGADAAGLDLAMDYLTHLIKVRFALIGSAEAVTEANRIQAEFEDFRAGRMQEIDTPSAVDEDGEVVE